MSKLLRTKDARATFAVYTFVVIMFVVVCLAGGWQALVAGLCVVGGIAVLLGAVYLLITRIEKGE